MWQEPGNVHIYKQTHACTHTYMHTTCGCWRRRCCGNWIYVGLLLAFECYMHTCMRAHKSRSLLPDLENRSRPNLSLSGKNRNHLSPILPSMLLLKCIPSSIFPIYQKPGHLPCHRRNTCIRSWNTIERDTHELNSIKPIAKAYLSSEETYSYLNTNKKSQKITFRINAPNVGRFVSETFADRHWHTLSKCRNCPGPCRRSRIPRCFSKVRSLNKYPHGTPTMQQIKRSNRHKHGHVSV